MEEQVRKDELNLIQVYEEKSRQQEKQDQKKKTNLNKFLAIKNAATRE